jgi:hypothetical protein
MRCDSRAAALRYFWRRAAQRKQLVGQLCLTLSVQMLIEEEIFHPAGAKACGLD